MSKPKQGAYTADHSLLDYILGITHEIWEEGGVDLIDQYYGPETVVYSLDGIVRGSAAMIAGTNTMLASFSDRLLLADDVIGTGDSHHGYSSHRVLSPMTNTGESLWGPATGKQVRIMNVADCLVEDAVIVKEWLARDNLALVRQLGFDVLDSARAVARRHSDELKAWFAEESKRLQGLSDSEGDKRYSGVDPRELLYTQWVSGDETVMDKCYSHYSVLHRSPVDIMSGNEAIKEHFRNLRAAFEIHATSIDHVCLQPAGPNAEHVAVRWSVCGTHRGDYIGIKATRRPVYIMGVTHRRIIGGRVAVEWTIFDSLGVLAQLV